MQSRYLVCDIENDSSNRYKRNVGNFQFDKIVCIGEKGQDYQPRAYVPNEDFDLTHLKEFDVLVGFNFSHDLLFLWHKKELQQWLQKGGKIWDCQLAEYYLSSFQNTYPKLRDIAVQKYGCKERPKHIDRLLFKKEETNTYQQVSDLPIELVLEDVQNDVLDTENIYLQQLAECEKRAILEVIELQMESLLATIEMEYNGMKVSVEKLEENERDLKEQLMIAQLKLTAAIALGDYWHSKIPFDYRSRTDLPILLFGGQKKITEKKPILDAHGCPVFIKTGANKGQIKLKNQDTFIKIKGLRLTLQDHWQTEKGNPSINEAVLNEIIQVTNIPDAGKQKREISEICFLLLEIRGLEKEISTYYESFKELVYETDGCIHGKFNHVSTVTGRLSSQDPNLQNIPKGSNSKVKEHFVSRY